MDHPRSTGPAPSGDLHDLSDGQPGAAHAAPDAPVPQGRSATGYLPALDGLRALSVVAVVAYHLGHLSGGFLGVDVFFVVSGFLITRILLAERRRTGGVSLVAFWRRRVRRLLPALLVVLAAVAVASRAWMPQWRMRGIRDDALATLAYVANWRFVSSGQSYFEQGVGPSPLRHAWSLAIEEQFYVLWPLVVVALAALVRRRPRLAVGVGALALAAASAAWMAVASTGSDLSRVYYGTDTRAFAVLVGAAVAAGWDAGFGPSASLARRRLRARRLARYGSAALVPLAVLAVAAVDDAAAFYRGGFQATAVLAALAVAGLATGEGWPARILGAAPLVWVGRRSYGIYLWSWPTQVLVAQRSGWTDWRLDAVVVAATVGFAAVSFRLVEEPARTGRWPWRRAEAAEPAAPLVPRRTTRVGASVAGLTASVVVVAALVSGVAVGAPDAPSTLAVSDEEAVDEALAPGGFGPGAAPPDRSDTSGAAPFDPSAPVLVDTEASVDPATVHDRTLRVMIAGDSVGWSLGWGLGDRLDPSVTLSNRALLACGIMPTGASYLVGDDPQPYWDRCERQAEAERLGIEAGPDIVLLSIGAWELYDQLVDGEEYASGTDAYAALLASELQARVDRYRAAGVPTVVPLVPCFGDVADWLGDERHDGRRRRWLNDQILAMAERNRGWVRVVDPATQVCRDDGSARAETADGTTIRFDGTHFDEDSAVWFWNTWLAGQLGAAFAPAAG